MDKGYNFSKIFGIGISSYFIFAFATFHILPFNRFDSISIVGISAFLAYMCYYALSSKSFVESFHEFAKMRSHWKIFIFEEVIFFIALLFWTTIRGFQPDIHGLEKFMDFGFVNSALRSTYFPPKDMWFTPYSINYYYFGHLVTAVLTQIIHISSNITFNLMLATIFAFCFSLTFSLSSNLLWITYKTSLLKTKKNIFHFGYIRIFAGGVLSALLMSFGGNLHTIYVFFKPYPNETPVPFWQLQPLLNLANTAYWYPNATRFIYNTIHEFPIYSFVVSDLHGHVLDMPFVFLTLALLFSFFITKEFYKLIFILFLLSLMYMTNAWDGFIYLGGTLLIITTIEYQRVYEGTIPQVKNPVVFISNIFFKTKKNYSLSSKFLDFGSSILTYTFFMGVGFLLLSLPFSLGFQATAIVHGIGVLCAPDFLTRIGHIGPILFEPNHCQNSPWWQLLILYGFFFFWSISLVSYFFYLYKRKGIFSVSDVFAIILTCIALGLIIIPEFFYVKDIYPAHYRANTMFKLVYQSFIMLSFVSSYSIITIYSSAKTLLLTKKIAPLKALFIPWFVLSIISLLLVSIYPYFAIKSYYGDLKTYHGLNGFSYLKSLYPFDYQAIIWINKNIKGQPIILEAQGDSYTDYARVSTNSGLPTVLGWTVHEWLWRGTYDIPAPRINEIQTAYETSDARKVKQILRKYNISYIFVGELEHQKYPALSEDKFRELGTVVYQNEQTRIYKFTSSVL